MRDGQLIGRGAVDMKGELAARAVAFAALARSGERPAGDVVLVAEADEERTRPTSACRGSSASAPTCAATSRSTRAAAVLLELADGRRVVTVSVGEKQVTSLRSASSAAPATPRSRPAPTTRSVTRRPRSSGCVRQRAPTLIIPTIARALSALGVASEDAEEAVAEAAQLHPVLADWIPAMTRMTVDPDRPADATSPRT